MVALAFSTATLSAQSVDDPDEVYDLASFTVKGELLERDLQETQTSVSLVPGEKLDRDIERDLFDLVDRLPNVNQEGGGFGFVIRGIATGGPGGGSAQAISVQVDGASIPQGQALHTGPVSTWDLEQVEVLLGPQSTQQGPNALAGAIIMRSKDPIFHDEMKLRADYGSFDETRFALASNKVISDQLALRFSYEDFRSDGDIKNEFTGRDNAQESLETARLKLRYQPSENLDAVLGHSYSDNRAAAQGINQDRFPAERVNMTENLTDGISNITNLRVNWDLQNAWKFSSESTYHKSNYLLNNPPPQPFAGRRSVDDDTFNHEFKFLYEQEGLSWASGAYYRKTEKDLDFQTEPIDVSSFGFPPGTMAQFGNTIDSENTNYAAFMEAEYEIADRWLLVAGLRYDKEEQDSLAENFTAFTPEPFPGANNPQPAQELVSDFDALLPKLGLKHEFTDDTSLGFTYQRGYRAGGSELNTLNELNEFDPEYTDNYELAFRSLLSEGKLTLNANVFYTQYDDMQVFVAGPSGTFLDGQTENAGSATMKGFEIKADVRASNNLSFFASIGHTDTNFDEYIGRDPSGNPIDFSGNRFPQDPEWTGSIGGDYYFGNGFEISVNGSYTGASYYTEANLPAELNESFFLVNARVGYQSDGFWSIYAYARNLFDEQYLARRRADGFGSAGDSRVVGINFNAKF